MRCAAVVLGAAKAAAALASRATQATAARPEFWFRSILESRTEAPERKIARLIEAFEASEYTTLASVPARNILALTGRVQAIASSSRHRRAGVLEQRERGRVEIGELIEMALRSKQRDRPPGPASHEALISAVLKSPIFPVIFLHLVQQRRADLVASLLELLLLVPPLPTAKARHGPFVALTDSAVVNWLGRTDTVIATDRPVLVQAVAKAKLRWHAAFLYHRWAEEPLRRDNAEVFERLQEASGGSAAAVQSPEPNGATSPVGTSMRLLSEALTAGARVQSNQVLESATCTLNMVKLFANPGSPSTAISSPSQAPITENEYAQLIYATCVALNEGRDLSPQERTTLAAAAFALQDAETAIQLLSGKVRDGQAPDLVDIGVMLAGIANGNIDAAVTIFLNKLNNIVVPNEDEQTARILQHLKPTPQLYSMLITKSLFKSRNDLVARLLADADERGMLSTAVLRSLDVILRQHVDVRPLRLLELLDQLTRANEWTPDPRILAWCCRCAARGQSLKEAMDRAQAHAASQHLGEHEESLGVTEEALKEVQIGSPQDLRAAVGILQISLSKLGYVHGPTVLLLVKTLAVCARRIKSSNRPLVELLDKVVQAVLYAKRVDLGSQQRSMDDTKWRLKPTARLGLLARARPAHAPSTAGGAQDDSERDRTRSAPALRAAFSGPFALEFFDMVVAAYMRMGDLQGAAEVVLWMKMRDLDPARALSEEALRMISNWNLPTKNEQEKSALASLRSMTAEASRATKDQRPTAEQQRGTGPPLPRTKLFWRKYGGAPRSEAIRSRAR